MSTSARIFINYRRSDSAGWARQLHGDLSARFGAERVFRDVAIDPGVDFVEHIERVMNACEVCIVVIGPRWTNTTNADGARRIDNPADHVRLEIERALQRTDVHVIPVLVDGARMPTEDELPGGLRALARRNACELTDSRWDYDVEVLCRRLRNVLGETTLEHERRAAADAPPEPRPARQAPSSVVTAVLATLAAAAFAGVLAASLSEPLRFRGEESDWARLGAYAIERGVVWAIVGAIVAAAAAAVFGRARMPLGQALVGAGAGWLGGAAGGAGYMALKSFGGVTEQEAHWLLTLVSVGLPAVLLARVLARRAGASVGECVLAAVAASVVAALLRSDDRDLLLAVHAVLVVGAIVAVIAAPAHRSLLPSGTAAPRGPAAI